MCFAWLHFSPRIAKAIGVLAQVEKVVQGAARCLAAVCAWGGVRMQLRAPGIATRSKDATRGSRCRVPFGVPLHAAEGRVCHKIQAPNAIILFYGSD